MTQDHLKSYLIVDCGTSVTSAILVERVGRDHSIVARAEAATTTEPPYCDVTLGVLNAVRQIEENTGKHLLDDNRIVTRQEFATAAADEVICTSSIGGGLQMMVAGLVGMMTAESAERAALGAGAVVLDVIAIDDGRLPHQRIQRIRELNPDIFLLSGGIDGGNIAGVIGLAEHIAQAKPLKKMPVIFAGNNAAREHVAKLLEEVAEVHIVDNLRPVLEEEVLEPTGKKIHELFMKYVVALAPGYDKLAQWTTRNILPTSGAVGDLFEITAREEDKTLIGFNIGSEMTDAFSVFEERFTRTVSGDLGLGSSIYSVLVKAGLNNIVRWLPFNIEPEELQNRLRNKMLRPGLVPETTRDLIIEHAVAREVLRIAFEEHKGSVVGLRGIQRPKDIAMIFEQKSSGDTLVDLMKLDLIVGSGNVFTRAPRPLQSLMIMLDAIKPQGITQIAIDKTFVSPHLGALANVDAYAAVQVYKQHALTYLGTVIAPSGSGKIGEICLSLEVSDHNGQVATHLVDYGTVTVLNYLGNVSLRIKPAPGFDVGRGKGKDVKANITVGECGIVVDTRGSELDMAQLAELYHQLNLYPDVKGV